MQGCKSRQWPLGLWIAFCLVTSGAFVDAAPPPDRQSESPSAWRDDAALHDVQFVGSRAGFAVGSQGAIWKTADSGRTWSAISSGVSVTFRSASFLTDSCGWVAGSEISPYTGLDTGVLLFTEDSGKTWQRVGKGLPPITYVKFFGLEEGVVVGRPTADAPAGILKTTDGGKSWQPVNGDAGAPWRAACFIDFELGVVAGAEGRLSLVGGEQLLASKLPPQGLRSIRSVAISGEETGWLAGDGGLVLRTGSGGVVWETAGSLPDELRIGMDFRCVDARGENVWLVGSPGSVVWHSQNGGRNWQRSLTGQATPLNAIRFLSNQVGIAVGELGVILRTEDGGKSWASVRGANRRAAVLSLQSRPSQVTAAMLAKLSGEQGYRGAVWIASRQDLGPMASAADTEATVKAAVEQSGGHSGDVFWQLPILIPGLEYTSDKLIADWQKKTEGKLAASMLSVMVRQIRTWRPNVVILNQPAKDDAASYLLFDAALKAIEQAGDATRYAEQRELTGLPSWKVDRIYVQLANGSQGDTAIDLDEYLPRRKMSVRMAATTGDSLVRLGLRSQEVSPQRQFSYRLIGVDGQPVHGNAVGRDFFSGISIPPGSDARRELGPIDETDLERQQKLVQRHRNFQAIADKSFDDPRMAGQMIGQLGNIVREMDSRQGAEMLRGLAEAYRQRSMYELVEATNVELIRRYPQEPAAVDAMRWLIQFWVSSETAWQRMQRMTNDSTTIAGNVQGNARVIQQAADTLTRGIGGVTTADYSDNQPALQRNVRPGRLDRMTLPNGDSAPNRTNGTRPSAKREEWRTGEMRDWHRQASELATQLEVQAPGLFRSPEIQFPLAALQRSNGSMAKSDSIFRGYLSRSTDAGTKSLAEREVWMMFATAQPPQALALCRYTNEKPQLDAVLADACWQDARELRLTSEPVDTDRRGEPEPAAAMMMFAYDTEFLYIGLSAPRREGASLDQPTRTGRSHDADLSRHDRVTVCLDVDRDYATWYEFQVDQRGCTFECCWEDRRWNPTWYVAADADATHWRIEAAIPWSELVSSPPQRGTAWGAALTRTTPTVGVQSWVHPAAIPPKPSSFGLLKFD